MFQTLSSPSVRANPSATASAPDLYDDEPAPPGSARLQAVTKYRATVIMESRTMKAIAGFLLGLGLAFSWAGFGFVLIGVGAGLWFLSTATSILTLNKINAATVTVQLFQALAFGVSGVFAGLFNFGAGPMLLATAPGLGNAAAGLQMFAMVAPLLDVVGNAKTFEPADTPPPVEPPFAFSEPTPEQPLSPPAEPLPETNQAVISKLRGLFSETNFEVVRYRHFKVGNVTTSQKVTFHMDGGHDCVTYETPGEESSQWIAVMRQKKPEAYDLMSKSTYDQLPFAENGQRFNPVSRLPVTDAETVRGTALLNLLNSDSAIPKGWRS